MSALLTLALLSSVLPSPARPQESVQFRLRPPLGSVMEFAISADAERLDGTPLFAARLVVAQRVRADGPNFRFIRYVSFAAAEGAGPLTKTVQEMNGLTGKSFPLVLTPTGENVAFKRGKSENEPSAVPSFAFALAEPVTVGQKIELPGDDIRPKGEVTLREVRELNGQRAAIFGLTGEAGGSRGSGTIVASATDGLLLLLDLRGEIPAEGARPAARVHLTLRRQNVPGLDRLAAELHLED